MGLGYDEKDEKSILDYAIKLEGKTFNDVIIEKNGITTDAIEAYANRFRKGGLGNLLEELFFGYKANSNQEADFPEAGVELKVTPYEEKKDGSLKAGERLVLTMISFDKPVECDFYKSHAWKKMKKILLIYYLRDKSLKSNLFYRIGFVRLFTPPEADLEIIKRDYYYIIHKIEEGKAHELSEGDTMYLGACTKGSTATKSRVPQYYGDKSLAMRRAFCFKNSYMTYVLNYYIAGKHADNSIIRDIEEIKEKSFEEILNDIVSSYIGKSDRELCEYFGREYNNNKAQWDDLVHKILGIRGENADEFEKANIKVKTVRIEENNSIRENISFKPFKFLELVNEEFDSSWLHRYFDETRIFFFIWEKDDDVYRVKGCRLWHMPFVDLDLTVRNEWERYKQIIKHGVIFTKYIDSKGKISFKNNLPNKKETKIIHVRPHAEKAAYRFNNGEEYGNVERDANVLPNGEYMTTQSFWLNNDYVLKQLNNLDN